MVSIRGDIITLTGGRSLFIFFYISFINGRYAMNQKLSLQQARERAVELMHKGYH